MSINPAKKHGNLRVMVLSGLTTLVSGAPANDIRVHTERAIPPSLQAVCSAGYASLKNLSAAE